MTVKILVGDCRDVLKTLPDESVHCAVTSPPYWGLRNYDVDGQIGLETTLHEHIAATVAVFREVRRVLRKDGTLWLNYGDAYSGGGRGGNPGGSPHQKQRTNAGSLTVRGVKRNPLKAKDRMLLPARIAIALCEDGWWLRDEIVWHKPNPMPSSVTDRTTPAHEMIYMLTRSSRYYYDADAIKEPMADSSVSRLMQPTISTQPGGKKQDQYESAGLNDRSGSRRPNEIVQALAARAGKNERSGDRVRVGFNARWNASEAHARLNKQSEKLVAGEKWGARHEGWHAVKDSLGGRNKRSVWTVPAAPFPDAHFATFSPALIEPCIKAGSPAGGTILDPFGGAGTTGLVADRNGRNAILIELNPDYAAMAKRRIKSDAGLFSSVEVA